LCTLIGFGGFEFYTAEGTFGGLIDYGASCAFILVSEELPRGEGSIKALESSNLIDYEVLMDFK
jgi:hypothetical protein